MMDLLQKKCWFFLETIHEVILQKVLNLSILYKKSNV